MIKIKKDIKLAPLTSFNIGGKADFFCFADNENDLVKAVNWAKHRGLNFFILANGSNVLISDKGFRGLVIKNRTKKINLKGTIITAESGVLLGRLIKYCLANSLSGLEFLAGIPGTVGGAIAGNAGPKFASISKIIDQVKVLDSGGKVLFLKNKDCGFSYRKSRFQKNKEVILSATFNLEDKNEKIINQKIKNFLFSRKNQPKGKSVGSIFKNPPSFSAGYLIEKVGLKGFKIGGAKISERHSNWIINLDNASSKDVLKLILVAEKRVKEVFKINLKREIRLIGDF